MQSDLIEQEPEQFARRGIHPVEVFDDQEHGLLLGQSPY